MSEPTPDPLARLLAAVTNRREASAEETERQARRQRLDERLATTFCSVIDDVGVLLAPQQNPPAVGFWDRLAEKVRGFSSALQEADREYPRFHIRERLNRAVQAGVPPLEAATTLLLSADADPVALATTLEAVQADPQRNVWAAWLPYLLDQLMNSHRPPQDLPPLPGATRDDWRRADLAFGCILFSDDVFQVLQESMDQAAALIDAAFQAGGNPISSVPPGRVRHLIGRFDPRALQWYAAEPRTLPLLQPPPSIEALTEPPTRRRELEEVWTAANQLRIALDTWTAWFVTLQEKGDAQPAVALNCSEVATRAIRVLLTHRPNVPPFHEATSADLEAMLPPLPDWWRPDSQPPPPGVAEPGGPRVRWQGDRTFLDRYYWKPQERRQKAVELRGAAAQLIDLLKTYPLSALKEPRGITSLPVSTGSASAPTRNDPPPAVTPRDRIDTLLCQAQSRQQQEEAARCQEEERARRREEEHARRAILASAFERACAFPGEQSRPDGPLTDEVFARWAERFVEVGRVLRECEERYPDLRFRERLRAAAQANTPTALQFAVTLLLLATEGDVGTIASALHQAHADAELRRFVGWLPYTLDRLWHPVSGDGGVISVSNPPARTSHEYQRAEQAFGGKPHSQPAASPSPRGPTTPAQSTREEETAGEPVTEPPTNKGADTPPERDFFLCPDCHTPLPEKYRILPRVQCPSCRQQVCITGVEVLGVSAPGHDPSIVQFHETYWLPVPPELLEDEKKTTRTQLNPDSTPALPPVTTKYLLNWREILDALELKNNTENQRKVRALNKVYDGPISLPGKGSQPRVSKETLLSWWNGLEARFQAIEQKQRDTQATLQSQHAYGRDGKVLPDLSGHVQKRRKKRDP